MGHIWVNKEKVEIREKDEDYGLYVLVNGLIVDFKDVFVDRKGELHLCPL